jgi:hypothetical protein
MNNKINYSIIFLCILCIILVSVISTGSKGLDWFLVIFSGIGILASSVYLIRKNEREEELQREEEEKRQREEELNKEKEERQNQIDNIKRQLDEIKKEEDAEAELFKQKDTEYINTLSLEDQEKLKDERIQIQQKILQIIEEYKNEIDNSKSKPSKLSLGDLDKISVLIINSMIDKKAELPENFFTNDKYKYGYLKPIKTLNNTDINVIISNINEYNKMSELGKFNYRKKYNKTDNTKEDHDYSEEISRYPITREETP